MYYIGQVVKNLEEGTIAAQNQDASFSALESLQDSVKVAESLHFPSEKITDSYNAIECLNKKLVEKVQKK